MPTISITLIKAQAFAVRICKAKQYLNTVKRESRMADQMYRSGTSIAANVSEAQYAQSKADFITKLHIALKEANETKNWLTILHQSGFIEKPGFDSMDTDVTELIKLLTASLNTAKRNLDK